MEPSGYLNANRSFFFVECAKQNWDTIAVHKKAQYTGKRRLSVASVGFPKYFDLLYLQHVISNKRLNLKCITLGGIMLIQQPLRISFECVSQWVTYE